MNPTGTTCEKICQMANRQHSGAPSHLVVKVIIILFFSKLHFPKKCSKILH